MKNPKHTVYHNNRCSKSRCALTHLDEKNMEYEVAEYLRNSYFKGKDLNERQWIDAMVKYPKLIERPIIVKDSLRSQIIGYRCAFGS